MAHLKVFLRNWLSKENFYIPENYHRRKYIRIQMSL